MPPDPNDQIFHLYTSLAAGDDTDSTSSGGLGYIDNKTNLLEITFEVPKLARKEVPSALPRRASHAQGKNRTHLTSSPRQFTGARHRKEVPPQTETIEISIQQDAGALHRETGNTGSVAWRSR